MSNPQSFVDDFVLKVAKLNIKELLQEHIRGRSLSHLMHYAYNSCYYNSKLNGVRLAVCDYDSCTNILLFLPNNVVAPYERDHHIIHCDYCNSTFCEVCKHIAKFKQCANCEKWSCCLKECDHIQETINAKTRNPLTDEIVIKPYSVCKLCKDVHY